MSLNGQSSFEFLLLSMGQKKEIKDAEIEQFLFEPEEDKKEDLDKKKRREVFFEMALFFVLGILLGITIKTEAVKRVTIGFSDYKIFSPSQRYNVQDLKKNLEQQAAEQQAELEAVQQQTGQNDQ